MLILCLGLAVFFLPHILREMGLREQLIGNLPSEGAYKGIVSLVSFAGLGLIIWGKAIAPFSMVFLPVFEWRVISHVAMLPAFILIAAGNMPPSHLSKNLKHPMLLGITIWGLAHLWANGDLASVLLFGSFSLWGLFKFVSLSRLPASPGKEPFIVWDVIAIFVGLVLYGLVAVYHGQLFGVGLSLV